MVVPADCLNAGHGHRRAPFKYTSTNFSNHRAWINKTILLYCLLKQLIPMRDNQHVRIAVLPDFMSNGGEAHGFAQSRGPDKFRGSLWILFVERDDFLDRLSLILSQLNIHYMIPFFILVSRACAAWS